MGNDYRYAAMMRDVGEIMAQDAGSVGARDDALKPKLVPTPKVGPGGDAAIPPPKDPKLRAEWEAAKKAREAAGKGKFVGDDKAMDASGYVVNRIGQYQIIEGSGPDGGFWFAKGRGENKSFKSRALAEEHARISG